MIVAKLNLVPWTYLPRASRVSAFHTSHSRRTDQKDDGDNKLVPSAESSSVPEIGKRDKFEVWKPPTEIARPKDKQQLTTKLFQKPLEHTYLTNRPFEDPHERFIDCLKPHSKKKTPFLKEGFDAYYDVCIIGGGIIGCATAYFLAQRVYKGLKICVVEKDPSYQQCSTTLSVGGLRQQFSLPENVEMSLFGADFIRQSKRLLYCHDTELPDVNFQPHGYLYLASEEGAEAMQENHLVQLECGAKVELLSPKRIQSRFPWINTEGVALGSYGFENEGWFDPWALLTSLKIKAMELGVHFIPGEVYNLTHDVDLSNIQERQEYEIDESTRIYNRIKEAHIYLLDGDVWPVNASFFVVAAGANSGHVAHLAGVGAGSGMLRVPLPVEPRKRYVYCVHAPDGPGLNCPLTIDPTGTYFRREGYGGHYLCGRSPSSLEEEPSIDDLEVDHDYFYDQVWPVIAHRAPAFNNLKVHSAWAGYYDYNYWDQNAIVGSHPHHRNLVFATGCSGHGIQQGPAIGRAVSEFIFEADFKTIDLTRFGFDRLLNDIKVQERAIV